MSTGRAGANRPEDDKAAEMLAAIVLPDLNPVFAAEMMSELCAQDVSKKCKPTAEATLPMPVAKPNESRKEYKPARAHIKRVPKEESHWYRRYLHPDQKACIERGESTSNDLKDTKMAKSFYSTFRVYFWLFKQLVEMVLTRDSIPTQ